MQSVKHTLFLVSGVSSFIIFYMGLVNFVTSVDKTTGLVLLIFSIFVSTGTFLGTVSISKSITKPIEKLAQNMELFSKSRKMSKQNPIKTNVKEIFELNKNFESMGVTVEKNNYSTKRLCRKIKNYG